MSGGGARDDDGLFVERVEVVVDQPRGHARGLGPDEFDESAAAGLAQGGRGSVALEEPGDGGVVQSGAEGALEAGVELGEQPRIRLLVWVASAARSWSKPVRTVSSAVISSVSSSERRVCGMVRAASAITAASLASVFA
ncbi:hypothetical protein GCM10022295_91540 [Streptomyces osmaniensis]|uniref:Uncharacterized protein n=1 Tax=Streptomyces osmaniensis TaxID=593134 RepID=A0ABP6Z6Y7_9ACTN